MPKPLLLSGERRVKEFEDLRQLVFRNADARIVDIDSDFAPFAAAADQNAPSRLGVSYGIGQQIAEDATKQYWIAGHVDIRYNGSKIDASLNGCILVFVPKPPEQGFKRDRGNLELIVASSQMKGIHQTIELFRQLRRGSLAPVQPCLLWHFFQA